MKGTRNGNPNGNGAPINPNNKPYHGHRRTNSRNFRRSDDKSKNQAGFSEESSSSKNMNDRLLYLVAKSIGCKALVTVSSGAKYRGLLGAADMKNGLSIVLKFPELVSSPPGEDSSNEAQDLPANLVVQSKDLMDLEIISPDLSAEDSSKDSTAEKQASPAPKAENESVGQGFRTDTDISGRIEVKERELQRWVPEEGLNGLSLEDELTSSNGNGAWDQFSVNEQKFGVESTYDEHLYTTRINRDASDYHQRLRNAERIAKEIEGQGANGNIHLAEERGIVVDDSGIDEEDKYSGVDRRGDELMAALRSKTGNKQTDPPMARTAGKYVPPKQRNALLHNDPAILASTGAPSERATPQPRDATPIAVSESKPSVKPSSTTQKPTATTPVTKTKDAKFQTESIRLTAQSEINSLKEFAQNFKIPQKFQVSSENVSQAPKEKAKVEDTVPVLPPVDASKLAPEKPPQEHVSPVVSSTSTPGASSNASTTPSSPSVNVVKPKKKMDPRAPAFRLNPQATAFTPSSPSTFSKSPALSNTTTNRSYGRRYTVTSQSFFGSKIPSEGRKKDLISSCNMFITIKKDAEKKKKGDDVQLIERAYITPPTWDFTVDEPYTSLYPPPESLVNHQPQQRPMMYGSPMGAIPQVIPIMPQMPYDANAAAFIHPGFMPGNAYPTYMPPNTNFNNRGSFNNGTPVIPMGVPGYQNFQRAPQGYPGSAHGYGYAAPPSSGRAPNPMSPQQNYSKFN